MAATFVQLSEEDPGLELVSVLDEINGKPADEAKAVPHPKLIAQVFSQLDKVMAASDEQINLVFNLTFSIWGKAPAADLPALVDKAIKALTAAPAKSPALKLRLLNALFEILTPDSPLRFTTLSALFQFALDTNAPVLASTAQQLKVLPSLITAWNLNPAQQSQIYLLAHKVCAAVKHQSTQHYLVEYLKSVKGAKELEAAKPFAATAVTNVLRLPNPPTAQLDSLFDLAAVKALSKDKTFGRVYDLLNIFVQEQVGAYVKFQKDKANADWVAKEIGEPDAILARIRSLSLCSLAAKKDRLSYKEIAAALEVKDAEVESAVIDAVMSGVIEARMDEENECVHISRFAQRHFDSWEVLSERLESWKNNVQNVLNTLHQFPAQQAAGGDGDQQYEE